MSMHLNILVSDKLKEGGSSSSLNGPERLMDVWIFLNDKTTETLYFIIGTHIKKNMKRH